MENDIVINPKYKDKRPRKQKEFTAEEINNRINKETKLATHKLKMFCIKNLLWIIPLCAFLIIAISIDLYVTLFVWNNPAVLFNQLKTIIGMVIGYIFGLYTDDIRKRITKY